MMEVVDESGILIFHNPYVISSPGALRATDV